MSNTKRMQHQTVSLFCTAAPVDATLLTQWETHLLPLRQARLIRFQSEWQLQAGEDRTKQSTTHLAQADYLVLLSAYFSADDDCLILMDEALVRWYEDRLQVIPLLICSVAGQACAWCVCLFALQQDRHHVYIVFLLKLTPSSDKELRWKSHKIFQKDGFLQLLS